MVEDAKLFASSNGMEQHAEIFGKAALVARDPNGVQHLEQLNDEERSVLQYEQDHKWNGPWMMWYTVGLCAIGAATQGWDQTGSNGANLSFPVEFGLEREDGTADAFGFWIVGLVNSVIFLSAGLM